MPIDPGALLITDAAKHQPRQARPCVPSSDPDHIVVCAPDEARFRTDNSTDEALREGRPVKDGLPRAPDFAPSCRHGGSTVCMRVGRAPVQPLFIDLKAIPEPLPAEAAEHVRRGLTAEERAAAKPPATLADPYATPPTPAGASPAAAR